MSRLDVSSRCFVSYSRASGGTQNRAWTATVGPPSEDSRGRERPIPSRPSSRSSSTAKPTALRGRRDHDTSCMTSELDQLQLVPKTVGKWMAAKRINSASIDQSSSRRHEEYIENILEQCINHIQFNSTQTIVPHIVHSHLPYPQRPNILKK
jgi:hypothetical protein